MTPLTRHQRHDRPSWQRAGEIVRGLAALAALVALLVGLPVLLYAVAGVPIPHRLPSPGQITDTLTRRDNGQLFLACLLVLAWAGWAAFAACVAVEATAQLRGRGAPRLPALGGPQRLAAKLVTAVAVAFLGAGPLLTPAAPARAAPSVAAVSVYVPAVAAHPIDRGPQAQPAAHTAPTAATAAPAAKRYTVVRGDTLWGIAEAHLGDPERYHEIARLNYDRPQHDGRTLTSAHWIYPGWILLLPPDATGLPALADTPSRHGGSSASGHQSNGAATTPPQQPGHDHSKSRPQENGHSPATSPTPQTTPSPATSSATPTSPAPPTRAAPTTRTTPPRIEDSPPHRAHPSEDLPAAQDGHAADHDAAGWLDDPLLPASVVAGLAVALTVVRLRGRRGYRPSPPAPSTVGPQPTQRLRRLAAPPTHDDNSAADQPPPEATHRPAGPDRTRPLTRIEIGRRDGQPVMLNLLDQPGLALSGPGAEPVAQAILADLLARAGPYQLHLLADEPTAQRMFGATPPVTDTLHVAGTPDAVLAEAEIACLSRSRLLADADTADYGAYRQAHPDDLLPLLVLLTGAATPRTAAQLTAVLDLGRRLGITGILLASPPAGVAGLDIAAGGQLTASTPTELAEHLRGVQLTGLPAGDASDVLATLATATAGAAAPTLAASGREATATHEGPAPTIDAAASAQVDTTARADAPAPSRQHTGELPPIQVRLLGPSRITAWDEEISTGLRGSARELLTYYLLQPDGATAEAAIDALWPDVDTERGRQRFWTALGNLRTRLRGPDGNAEIQIVAKHGEHYRADPQLLHADLWQFQSALTDAEHAAGNPAAEAAALQRAVDTYGGDLADGADYLWAEAAREDLHRRALDAHVRLADLHADQPQQAIADLDHAIRLDPYAEELYRRLIRLHAATGRPEAARRTYRQLRERLADLDLEPEAATAALITHLSKPLRQNSG